MSEGNLLRLVISEENPVLRLALEIFFDSQSDIEVVGQAADSGETLQLCEQHHPDVVLVDSKLRPMNIMRFIGRVCDDNPDTQIVVFASNFDETAPNVYQEAGAAATVTEGIFASDLLNVIQTVYQGQ